MIKDEERVHVLSLEDDVRCVVVLEARELLAERGRARQKAGGTTFPTVPGCFNNSSEVAGKLSFYHYAYLIVTIICGYYILRIFAIWKKSQN